ncbi:MAG: hypothetical protein QXO20_08105 [Candidatus Bathyarchaeia archaeon]
MKTIVEFFERLTQIGGNPRRGAAILGLTLGAGGVIAATYALMRIKGVQGKVLDGIKIGAGCPICRSFWTGVGLGVIGIIWFTYLIERNGS